VGASGTIFTSPDSITWTKWSSGLSDHLISVVYANNIFVAVGGGGKIITSVDGSTWIRRTSGTTIM
jgi:hypothetical protein